MHNDSSNEADRLCIVIDSDSDDGASEPTHNSPLRRQSKEQRAASGERGRSTAVNEALDLLHWSWSPPPSPRLPSSVNTLAEEGAPYRPASPTSGPSAEAEGVCPVCFEAETADVFPSCGHSLCHRCLISIITSVPAQVSQVPCPLCRAHMKTFRIRGEPDHITHVWKVVGPILRQGMEMHFGSSGHQRLPYLFRARQQCNCKGKETT